MTKLVTPFDFRPTIWSKFLNLWMYLSQDNDIYRFLRNGIGASYSREEAVMHLLSGVLALLALTLYALNATVFHFTSIPLSPSLLIGFPILLMIWWLIGHVHRPQWPRLGLLAITSANLCLLCTVSIVGCIGIISTPFVTIDHQLMQWDLWLGFDLTVFMAWVHQFPYLVKVLNFSYNTWVFQVILAPILLAILKRPKEINQYFLAGTICMFFWCFIYYFFPTVAPAGVMHSPYFISAQYSLVRSFQEIHQFLPISHYEGGLISFPSGHVMYSLLVLVALRNVKVVFYPMLVVNFFLIMGTMALGYHYLVDVLASFLIVTLVLSVLHFYSTQSLASKNS